MLRKILGAAASAALLNVIACSDDNTCDPVDVSVESSSSVEESSSSEVITVESSSSAKSARYEMSSSVKGSESSSSAKLLSSSSEQIASSSSVANGNCTEPNSTYNMWNGPAIDYQVNTGVDNGSETSGYWFTFLAENSETSSVIFPRPNSEYVYGDELFLCCEGVCGAFDFVDMYGPMGIGFYVAGESAINDKTPALGDISSWGGVCITYASEDVLNVVLSNIQDEAYEKVREQPRFGLPKTLSLKTVCLNWDDFTKVNDNLDPSQVASVLFYADGDAQKRVRFKIAGLGKYTESQNFCEQGDDPFVAKTEGYKNAECSFDF